MVYDRSRRHLSVTAPGDSKKKHVNSANCFLLPLFAHVIAASYKKGAAHYCELEMYVCDLCNRSFSTQGSLKRHRESVHRQSVGFSYQFCGQRFYRKNVLQRHLKTHRAACPTDKAFVRELKHEDFSRRRRRR